MILVDSSVWIDYFNGAITDKTDKLDRLLAAEQLLIGDLIVTEVLQGFVSDSDFNRARELLKPVPIVSLGGEEIAVEAAKNFRKLRRLGITVRKTIDTIIATQCIHMGYELLHDDRDFDPFVKYLGLRVPD
ncbi:MAG: PIN domain nuclease [Bryobacterales bacterium]|nr:PIN domain nuclease [Bryobacterales bacterium]MBV9397702.1 PIN domain nuclease [Bryobacterales bacterium]